ncbi:MAG: F0F1 ATP synthase subunit B [Propionibacteriaceae bacterium]|jgi:F-type H+-transporting ATPase subunit b|nr:F0F1 ATP synthase subunit B [Propionibacteriaceae bacterium]
MIPLESPLGPLLPEHISELVVGTVLFVIILVVMWKVVSPRMEKMYTERANDIRGGIERADKAQAEAQEALAAYQAKLATAQDEAQKIREAAKASGAQVAEEIKAQAEQDAQRIVATAHTQVEAEKAHVVDELRRDIGGMATTLASKIVGETLDDDARVKKTVDDFIASLEKETV